MKTTYMRVGMTKVNKDKTQTSIIRVRKNSNYKKEIKR